MEKNNYLRIKVDGPTDVPFDAFRHVLNSMSEVASEVDKELSDGKRSLKWNITGLHYGSAELIISPQPIKQNLRQPDVSMVIREGIASIQKRQSKRPSGFTDKALRCLRNAITALPQSFTFVVADGNDSIEVNTEAVAQIDQWMAGQFAAIGTVEGRLERVSGHGKLEFTIYDEKEHKIQCYFPDKMKDDVRNALWRDVSIRGIIVYRADGVPISIRPDDNGIQPIEVEEDFSAEELRAMIGIADLNMKSEDYVRSLRDE